ncbi:hypothetical protein [Mesobacterium pallidum]|uniref:hypothetical protein n=1 Tax=Mesobacterium pallidum TaxID=2872037 RepID=UPI001EE286F5|nr:hypothetical protein [Mesobacterium pallidum]
MKTWLTGNSHTAALYRGLAQMSPQPDDVSVYPLGSGAYELAQFHEMRDGQVVFTASKFAEHTEKETGQTLVNPEDRWGFVLGTQTSRLFRDPMWRTADPVEICQPGRRPVPSDMLAGIIAADQKWVLTFLADCKAAGVPMFVVACPPPRSDHVVIEDGARPETVLFIDRLARKTFTDALAKLDIPFIAPPAEVIDDAGFLKPEYFAPDKSNGRRDGHHANDDYGQLMMAEVLSFLEGVKARTSKAATG